MINDSERKGKPIGRGEQKLKKWSEDSRQIHQQSTQKITPNDLCDF